jgi:hypothetical protein
MDSSIPETKEQFIEIAFKQIDHLFFHKTNCVDLDTNSTQRTLKLCKSSGVNGSCYFNIPENKLIIGEDSNWSAFSNEDEMHDFLEEYSLSLFVTPAIELVFIKKDGEETSIGQSLLSTEQITKIHEVIQKLREEYANYYYDRYSRSGNDDDKSDEELRKQADEKAPEVIFPDYKG